jgi:hypothetical protein
MVPYDRLFETVPKDTYQPELQLGFKFERTHLFNQNFPSRVGFHEFYQASDSRLDVVCDNRSSSRLLQAGDLTGGWIRPSLVGSP